MPFNPFSAMTVTRGEATMNKEEVKIQDIQLTTHYKSLDKYQKSLEQFSQLKSGLFAAKILLKIGDLYRELEDNDQALENYQIALKLYQDEENYSGEALSLKSIGEIWKEKKEYAEARKYLKQSLQINKEIKDYRMMKNIYEQISECYQKEGFIKNALNLHLKVDKLPLSPDEIFLNKFEINKLNKILYDVKPSTTQFLILVCYAIFLLVAELITYYHLTPWNLFLEVIIIISLVTNSLTTKDLKLSYLLQALILLPLLRIMGLIIPVTEIQPLYWLVIISIPLAVAILILMKNLQINRKDVGITTGKPFYQLLIGLSGISLGMVEYLILQPGAIVSGLTTANIILASSVIMLSTGLIEELIFRGIIQKTAESILGNWGGIIFASILFTSFNIMNSPLNLIFTFLVSLFYGYIYQKTGSILGVSISHGLCNMLVYLYLPFIL
jgi:membrane protease YdiL (CAAX protease family)/predicted negative regulator of RcsB-dependent stress response